MERSIKEDQHKVTSFLKIKREELEINEEIKSGYGVTAGKNVNRTTNIRPLKRDLWFRFMKNIRNGISEALKIFFFSGGACPQTPLAPRAFGARFPCAYCAYLDGKPRYAPETSVFD